MLRIVFCDDEEQTVRYYDEYLSAWMKKNKIQYTTDVFTDSARLLSLLYTEHTWDIYFLDIDMPTVNGLDLGKKIREMSPDSYLIYLSVHRELVFDTFENKAFRFIPKDEFQARIGECLESLIADLHEGEQSETVVLDSGGKLFRYRINDIQYIKSTDKYIELALADGSMTEAIRYKMSDLEEQLTPGGFIRIHRSYLVNYRFIRRIGQADVILDDGTHLQVSRYRMDALKQAFRTLTM